MSQSRRELPNSSASQSSFNITFPTPHGRAFLGPRMGLLLATLAHATWTWDSCIRLRRCKCPNDGMKRLADHLDDQAGPCMDASPPAVASFEWKTSSAALSRMDTHLKCVHVFYHSTDTARRATASAHAVLMPRLPKMQQRNIEVVDAQAKQIIHIPRTLVPSPE